MCRKISASGTQMVLNFRNGAFGCSISNELTKPRDSRQKTILLIEHMDEYVSDRKFSLTTKVAAFSKLAKGRDVEGTDGESFQAKVFKESFGN